MKKKIAIVSIIILVLLVTFGISVAVFSFAQDGDIDAVTFNTANFKFKYTELTTVGNGINITEAEPMSDSDGKIQNDYFDFKVEADDVYEGFIYEVVLEELGNNSISHDAVKVYLTEIIDDNEVEVGYSLNDDTSVKNLNEYNETKTKGQNGRTIYAEKLGKGTTNYEKIFRARVFIKDGIDITDSNYMNTETNFRINVFVNDKISYCRYSDGDTWDFNYLSSAQEFVVPCDGEYQIELWGAQGYKSTGGEAGKGGYVSGQIELEKDKSLYFYVGNQGTATASAWNGAGICHKNSGTNCGTSGGGGVDVRLISGAWNNAESLRSRIMVAGSGGGAGGYNGGATYYSTPGAGGGLTGYSSGTYESYPGSTGGNQTAGGKSTNTNANSISDTYAAFGMGPQSDNNACCGASGGSGWYGGGGGCGSSAGGGSAYISGHTGCVAVTSTSSSSPKTGCTTGTIDKLCSISPYEYAFTNTKMIDGNGYSWTNTKGSLEAMPNPTGGYYANGKGHTGNGYARITLVKGNGIKPSFRLKLDGKIVTLTADKNVGVVGYSFSTSSLEPLAFIDVDSNEDLNVNWKAKKSGKYYAFTIDTNGNVAKQEIIIPDSAFVCKYEVNQVWNFAYTGSVQEFIPDCDGEYQVELWGAQGGSGSGTAKVGGSGSYTSGKAFIKEDQPLYVYVGGVGANKAAVTNVGGYNGGGYSGNNTGSNSFGGGGATDVRLIGGVWNNAESLRSRVMVAAGGGGNTSTTSYTTTAGYGGGITSRSASGSYTSSAAPTGSTQVSSGTTTSGKTGSFGYAVQTNVSGWGGGGGGGWYGGATGNGHSGAGGTSYISGHTGCVAVTSISSSSPKPGCTTGTVDMSCSLSPYNFSFNDTMMIDGYGYSWSNVEENLEQMPNPAGGLYNYGVGNTSNGYARITYLGTMDEKPNVKVVVTNNMATINILSYNELSGYGVSATKLDEPSYTELSGTKATIQWSTDKNGTYYVWVKDVNNKITKEKLVVDYADCPLEVGDETLIPYSGSSTKYTTTCKGKYKIELWGAQGGSGSGTAKRGGYGGYTSGIIDLDENTDLYVYVGGVGANKAAVTNVGGYNGGGYSGNNSGSNSYGGGGATDVRYFGNTTPTTSDLNWNSALGLRSRIMVAAGGGGNVANTNYTTTAGAGGGLTGRTAAGNYNATVPGGGTQIGAGATYSAAKAGVFGYAVQTNVSGWGGGGGGGYWGGSTGHGHAGAGGSSFISGHTGCVAIASSAANTALTGCTTGTTNIECSKHYSGLYFTNTAMIDGAAYIWTNVQGGIGKMPNPNGTYYARGVGHTGSGYARITYLGN